MSSAATGAAARAAAARTISTVIDRQRSLDVALAGLPPTADRALIAALAYGALREYRLLDALLAPRLKKPPQPLLKALLLVGLYQLEYMRMPARAAVHATVAAAPVIGLPGARGMVNAVLRTHQRERPAAPPTARGVRYSHPDWLVAAIETDWPARAQTVLAANNSQAPMHLRVNRRRTDRAAYLQALAAAGISAAAIDVCPDGITLETPCATSALPDFAEGPVSVQDGAAQLAAGLLAPKSGDRVLDACAAPGNKSAHLLERADIDLVALDADPDRLATLEQTLARLGLTAEATRAADAADTGCWWDGRAFDRILLDAPCSGTGVIRRHPDIKWLRRSGDIGTAAERQARLLRALWPTLAPGGRLVYATCSILRAEGADVVAAFLAEQADAREIVVEAAWGEAESCGRRIAPGEQGFDGFYYAVLERRR